MNKSNAAPGFGPGLGGDPQDEQLDRAIAELRGVLHEDERGPAPGGNSFLSALGATAGGLQGAPAFGAPSAEAPFGSSSFGSSGGNPGGGSLIMNIPVDVQIVLGAAEMPVSELLALQKGSTVALNRRIGEPVDVVVNGRRIARGEITVLESDPSRFGIRLTEITAAD